MYTNLWEKVCHSVCSINFYNNGFKILTITGFKLKNCIITDCMIYGIEKCESVIFQFVEEDGYTISQKVNLSFKEFQNRINQVAIAEGESFAVIEFDLPEVNVIPSLSIDLQMNTPIGSSIASLGYHDDFENLSIKTGMISSFLKMPDGNRYLQFESAITFGNSGSPLIDVNTGHVIGIVGYRLAKLSKTYDSFRKIIDENLRVLKQSEGMMNILDIDPIQVLIANQNQLKQLFKTFYTSTAISFGYARDIQNVVKYISEQSPLVNTTYAV